MKLKELLRDEEFAPLFEDRLNQYATQLGADIGTPAETILPILRLTADLSATEEPQDIQLRRIKGAGFTEDDLQFLPSLEEAIENVGKDQALHWFAEYGVQLKHAYEVYNFLYEAIPPLLTHEEWSWSCPYKTGQQS